MSNPRPPGGAGWQRPHDDPIVPPPRQDSRGRPRHYDVEPHRRYHSAPSTKRLRAAAGTSRSVLARRRPFDAGFLLAAGLSGVFYTWIVVGGLALATRLADRQHYFTAGAVSILHGRLDVSPSVLGGECFYAQDRCYGYFGITPSLLRLPVVLFYRTLSNGTEALYFVLGFAAVGLGVWWLSRQIVDLWAPSMSAPTAAVVGFVCAGAALGASPMLFLGGMPLVYHEAILWGVAFATLGLAAALSLYVGPPRICLVLVIAVSDTLAMLARPTVGATALVATVLVGVRLLSRRPSLGAGRGRRTRLGLLLVAGAFVAFASSFLTLYAKFGTLSPPFHANPDLSGNPFNMYAITHAGPFNPAVVPTKVWSTVRPDTLNLFSHPPYVALGDPDSMLWPARRADLVWEPTSSVTATMPFSTAAALIGFLVLGRAAIRRRRNVGVDATSVLLVSSLGAAAVELGFPGQSYRYVVDLMPILFVTVPVGLAWCATRLRHTRLRVTLAAVGVLLLSGQLVVQSSVAIVNAMTDGGGAPAGCPGAPNPYGVLGEIFCPRE